MVCPSLETSSEHRIHVCTSAASQVYPPIFVEVHDVVDLSFPHKIYNLVPPPTVSFFKQCVAQFRLS